MVHFFYKRSRANGPTSIRRAVLLGVLSVLALAIPFVDFIIWVLFYPFGLGRDDFTVFAIIGPVATTLAVLAIIAPVIIVWSRMFRQVDEEASKAEEAQKEAERLLAQRADFVAYVSHEIRNPLNGIMGIADSLETENLDPDLKKNIDIIRYSADDLMFILNDILDIAKIDEGQVQLHMAPVSLRELINQIYNFWKPRAKAAGLKLELTFCETFPDYVNADAQRFRQVTNNLVSNAIKYSERGSVLIAAECDHENQLAEVSVLDTGVGVPPNLRELIFEPYQQVEPGDRNAPRKLGTGLGLPIARRLARLMQGDVVLLSSGPAGSKFKFSFAVEPIERPAETVITQERLREFLAGKSVLIADDSMASAIVAREHLNKLGLKCDLVTSGQSAVEKLNAEKFDFVFLDDNLGDMRGWNVIENVNEKNGTHYVAYTGRPEGSDREEFLKLGFDGYVSKPALFDAIKNELARLELPKT